MSQFSPRAPVRRASRGFVPLSAALVVTGCAGNGLETGALQLANPDAQAATATAAVDPVWSANLAPAGETEMVVKPAIAAVIKDARAARSGGDKAKALATLDGAPEADTDPALVKERGLLAAEMGQLGKAQDLLRKSVDPKAPDWRVHSALGATLSAAGKQAEAREELNRALALSPDHPAILNNLALTYALDGKHEEAERMLRTAASNGAGSPQPKQNLALILGLKGDIDEARKVSSTALPKDKAEANVSYLERVKVGGVAVSRADAPGGEAVRSASAAGGDAPIMQLTGAPN